MLCFKRNHYFCIVKLEINYTKQVYYIYRIVFKLYYKTIKNLNKMIKVGINGFGRIGRFVFRVLTTCAQ